MAALPTIEFDGIEVKPDRGVYRCPHKCGRPDYPQPSWKTEAGFRRHIAACPKSASATKAANERGMRDVERKAEHTRELEEKKEAFLSTHQFNHNVGDIIYFVRTRVVKPTHDRRGRKVRYEEIRSYEAGMMSISSIDAVHSFNTFIAGYRNGSTFIPATKVFASHAEAVEKAKQEQASYDEHVDFSRMCR